MADVNEQRAAVQDARDKNGEAGQRFHGMGTDVQAALAQLEDIPQILAATADVLDTQLTNSAAAKALSEEAQEAILVADENLDFQEAQNAHGLLDHMSESADGVSGILTEAKEALVVLVSRLDEIKLSLEAVNTATEECEISSGSAEENLDQLAQRLG